MLEIESTNVKALYRRAQAYINMADLDLAEFDIKKALEIDPNNRWVHVWAFYCCFGSQYNPSFDSYLNSGTDCLVAQTGM